MQDGIPERKYDIELPYLTQNFRSKYKNKNNNLESSRQFYLHRHLDQAGDNQKQQREDT